MLKFVVANKIDVFPVVESVSSQQAGDYAKQIQAGYHEVSAKDGTGI